MNDREYMNLALAEAVKARQLDEVPVGAVVVDTKGNILGYGHNQTITRSDPSAHAEMLALRNAAKKTGNYRLCGATLYTTIEPCIMCMGAVIHARLSRVVFGAPDPRWGAAGALYNFASDARLNHNLEVVSGICEDETRNIIRSFFRNKRRKPCQTL
ncbi:tRNA adenosine(34) deaminase TadA [Desulfocicer niacini]